jgi:ABC-type Mn2+/Zn2+ transport system permease subunit
MDLTLVWILGAVAGAVLWSGFLRLPGHLARWLCEPYGQPGRVAMVVSMLISVAALGLVVVGALLGLSQMIGASIAEGDAKRLRGILFISSILGYALVPVLIRAERLLFGRRKR